MSGATPAIGAESEESVREAVSPVQMMRRIARGELGEVRVLVGIAVIWTIFQIANDRFLSAVPDAAVQVVPRRSARLPPPIHLMTRKAPEGSRQKS